MAFSKGESGGLPSGALTIMFTDLEDSTGLWELDAAEMRRVMNVHDDVMSRVVDVNGGTIFKNTGDGIGAVFTSPSQAADAAITIQRHLQAVPWRTVRPRVRIGLHLGDITPTRGDYYGAELNRAARIMDVANGDQIAISDAVAAFVDNGAVVPMGEHELRGIGSAPINLLVDERLVQDDRPLRAQAIARRRFLPAATGPSIGRAGDVDAIVALLAQRRLLTIVGPGGVGKTHVALAAGRQLEHHRGDGAILIELDAVTDGGDVVDAVAAAVGARVQPGLDLLDSVCDFLGDRELLVILDNCEHVIEAVAPVVERLVRLRGMTLLVTSRVPLGFVDEQLYPLAPLGHDDGAELFITRTSNRDPYFAPAAVDREAIGAISAAVDGMPLGIELAAAWARVLPLDAIALRLQDSVDVAHSAVGTRDSGLSSQSAAFDRQNTVHATIDWSYQQLEPSEALLFERLSVFVGGFSADAVARVCADREASAERRGIEAADVPSLLMSLVDKSMIVAERHDRRPRFMMLRPLQLFASECLTARDDAAERSLGHAEYFSDAVAQHAELLTSEREGLVWEFFELEWANIRQAFARLCSAGRAGTAAQLLLDLGWYSTLSVRSEAFAWADDLLASEDVESLDSYASLLGLRAIHKYFSVDERSRLDAEHALAVDPRDPYGFSRIALGAVWVKNQHEHRESDGWTIEWIESLNESSPMMSRLWAYGMRAFHLCVHNPSAAETVERIEMIEQIAADTRSPSAEALARWSRGMYAASTDPEGARAGLDDWEFGRLRSDELSNMHLVAHLITSLELHFTAEHGDLERVLRLCREALERARDHHYVAGTSHLFGVTSIVLTRVGRTDLAAQLVPLMAATGDVPRQNAIDVLAKAAGQDAAALASLGQPSGALSAVADAARVAAMALSEALEGGAS